MNRQWHRICALLVLTALVLRLVSALPPAVLGHRAAEVMTLLTFGTVPETLPAGETDFPALSYTPPADKLSFSTADAQTVTVDNDAGAVFDAAALLTQPLSFPDGPKILIVHTHATEAYADSPNYRSEDTSRNVVRVGQALADALNALGVETLHHRGLNDLEGYNDSYGRMEETIAAYLETYPSICMVIDLHRDAAQNSDGTQAALRADLLGESAAQLLLVMGTDLGDLYHPNWQDNLSMALKLQVLGEKEAPGLFRDLNLRAQRYNQHMTPYSILLEVGAAGNSLEEAVRSAEFFAQLLAQIVHGT